MQLLKNFPVIYGTRRFITVFTKAPYWSLFWARSTQFIPPHSIFLKSILILSTTYVVFSEWTLSLLISHRYSIRIPLLPTCATCPIHHTLIDIIILITHSEEYKLWLASLCSVLQSSLTSSLFGPNILLRTLFSNNLSLCSSLNIRHSFTSIQNHRQNYSFVYYNFYVFKNQTRTQRFPDWMVASISRIRSLLTFSLIKFWFVTLVPKYLNCATFLKNLLAVFYIMILPCILVTRQIHIFSFLCIYF
jgi:hypothetical protein